MATMLDLVRHLCRCWVAEEIAQPMGEVLCAEFKTPERAILATALMNNDQFHQWVRLAAEEEEEPMRHTLGMRGQWHLSHKDHYEVWTHPNGKGLMIATVLDPDQEGLTIGNAKLVAAAPVLQKALKTILELTGPGGSCDNGKTLLEVFRTANAALDTLEE